MSSREGGRAPSIGQKLLASGGVSRVSAMCTCIYFMVLALWTSKHHTISAILPGIALTKVAGAGATSDGSFSLKELSNATTSAQEKSGGSDGHRNRSSSGGSAEKKTM
jgi:hypothetical protein